ncbi:PAS domain S-box protein [Exiguobacterium flavidum]|uniref:PAS domain S-box protein n=1 Tax=Exiguobacterium flavidum TaxID=2184695 RepID=UPI000DF7546D|nr:PAS domain S-box protein [Exiguobacterium flavidum]
MANDSTPPVLSIQAVLSASPNGMALLSRDGTIHYANPAFIELFPRTEEAKTTIYELWSLDSRETLPEDVSFFLPHHCTISQVEGSVYHLLSLAVPPVVETVLDAPIDAAMIVTDGSFKITRYNEGAAALFGYSASDAIGRMTPVDLHDRQELDARKLRLEKINLRPLSYEETLLVHGRDTENEWTYRRKNGSILNGRLFMTPLDDGQSGYFLIILDITGQKQLERHLTQSERRFRLFSESVVEAVIFHENGIILDANRAAEIIFRTTLELMKGHQTSEFIAEPYREDVLKRIESHQEEPYEVVGRRADGTLVEIEVFPREIFHEKQRMRVAVVRDITERKRIERMLEREKNAIMRQRDIIQSILQASNEGFLLTEEDGSFIFMNIRARKLLDIPGIAPSKIQERISLIPHIDAQTKHFMLEEVEGLLAGRIHEVSFRFAIQRPNETTDLYYELYGTPVTKEKSRIGKHGFLFAFRDRTEEEKMDQVKNELVSTVSHELRTPLSSILGYMELLLHRQVSPEKTRRYIETVHNEANRLTSLLNDFLDIQRMEDGRQQYEFEEFSLHDLVIETVETFSETARHTISLHSEDDPLFIQADRNKIKQVLINLMSNAIKYSPHANQVDLTLTRQEDHAVIEVKDYGIGIPHNSFDKLFTKFYRVDNSDVRKIGGTGLGLAICKEIIESHGGSISVESEVGKGSLFSVMLELHPRKERIS